MTATKSCATTYLDGDWTITGIVRQLPRLMECRFGDDRVGITVAVDCSGIEEIDQNGFELLYVWLNCIKLRGLRTELVNIPDGMYDTLKLTGGIKVFETDMPEYRLISSI